MILKKKCFINLLKNYIFAFFISLLLMMLNFLFAVYPFFNSKKNYLYYIFFSIFLQIFIQFKYFLHFEKITKNFWNISSLYFTILIIFIICFGSVWIMHHLNH